VGAQYTDDMETLAEDVTGRTGRLDAYHRLDANLRYRHAGSGLTATLAIKDLLDRPFIISRRPEGIFAAGFRQIIFGLRYDYAKDD
jgi:Fe(3+) dicitrate transport protein